MLSFDGGLDFVLFKCQKSLKTSANTLIILNENFVEHVT